MRSDAVVAGLGGLWLSGAAAVLVFGNRLGDVALELPTQGYAVATLATSLVCLLLYAVDKSQAVRAGRRVSEQTLHLWALLGGWPGGMIASWLFRHKTRKLAFRAVLWGIALLHVGGASVAYITRAQWVSLPPEPASKTSESGHHVNEASDLPLITPGPRRSRVKRD